MGIANTTVASAITSAILEVNPKKVTGRGSNISDERLKNKLKVIRKALKINQPNPEDGLDVLKKVGGFEFGAMAGVMIEAAKQNCIVILDGFNTAAAALIADLINPDVSDYIIASHIGREIGHLEIIQYFGFTPLFTLDLALGEAVGSSIAAKVLDSLVYTYVCSPDDDFDGDLTEFKDEDTEESMIANLLGQIGFDDIDDIDNLDDLQDFFDDTFDGDLQVDEVDLDFKISDDTRFNPYEPPFSVQTFNIPRSYPIMIREMNSENDDKIAATDKTFNFYLQTMPTLNLDAMDACRELLDSLTKPKKSLGLLEDIAAQFAGISKLKKPSNKLRRAALAFTNSEYSPNITPPKKTKRRNLSLDFSMTVRMFAMKIFLGVVDPKQNPTVAFNFGRTLSEEISFGVPILTITELTDWKIDLIDEKFEAALLNKDGSFKVPPDEFLNHIPQKFKALTGAIIGAMVAAAHNSTLIIVDCGAVEIIARFLETICPQIRPFILHATELINYDFKPGERIGYDGETACIGAEIVEAALTAINEMKTFKDTSVDVAIDGTGAEVQSK
jgi:nicotinate-nucleotide--dimethylbenzimidazole phosphoribosyltransferase